MSDLTVFLQVHLKDSDMFITNWVKYFQDFICCNFDGYVKQLI